MSYRWVVLAITTFSQAAVSFVTQGVPTLAPFIQSYFGISRAQVGFFSSAMNLGALPMVVVAGRAVDVLGERLVIAAGAVATGLMMVVVSRAPSYQWGVAALMLTGVWSASATPAGSKAVMSWFPLQARGMAMGIRQTGVPIGGMMAALVLPPLAEAVGWKTSLVIAGAVCVAGGAICYTWYVDCPFRLTQEPASSPGPAFPSALPPAERPRRSLVSWREVSALLDRNMLLLGVPATFYVAAQFIIVTYLQLFLRETLGFHPARAAKALALTQFFGIVSRIGWGHMSDRFFGGSRKKVIFLLGCGMTVGALGMAGLRRGVHPGVPLALAAVLGSTTIGWNGLLVTLLSELAGKDRAGTAVGIGLTFTQIGIISGPPLFGLAADVTGSYRAGWLLVALVLAVGTICVRYVEEPLKTDPSG